MCPFSFIMNNIQGHLQKMTHKYCLKSPEMYRNRTKQILVNVLETQEISWDSTPSCRSRHRFQLRCQLVLLCFYAVLQKQVLMLSLHILLSSELCDVLDRSGYILLQHLKEEVLVFYTVWWSKTSVKFTYLIQVI